MMTYHHYDRTFYHYSCAKGCTNLIELLPRSDDSALCDESSPQHLPLTLKRLNQFVHMTSIYRLSVCHMDLKNLS